jgi:hypothetical protein
MARGTLLFTHGSIKYPMGIWLRRQQTLYKLSFAVKI